MSRLPLLRQLLSHTRMLPLLVLLCSLTATLAAWHGLRQTQQRAAEQHFQQLSHEVLEAIEKRMENHRQILLGGAGLIDASQEVSRDEWRRYVDGMRPMLDIAQQNSLRLSRLINDLLDMDKLAAGKLASAQHRVELKLDRALPLRIRADALRLQQVLANFLSSAIKFSAPAARSACTAPGITGACGSTSAIKARGSPNHFAPISSRSFPRLTVATSARKAGPARAWRSVKSIEHMGGQIGFDSAEGCGSTFWFELPLLDDDPADLQPERQQPAILVAESDPESSHLLQSLLQRAGYRVLLAGSLAQARALLLSERIAAITLDPHLPDGDGLQRIQELHDDPARHQLPVLVIATSCHQGRLSLADFIPANDLAQARELLEKGGLDLILLGLSLPDGNGLELLEDIQRLHPSLPVVVLSSSELSSKQLSLVAATLAKSRTDTQHFLNVLARLLPAKENHHA